MTDEASIYLGSTLGKDERDALHDEHAEIAMHDQIAANWDSWSALLGRSALTVMEKIRLRVPELNSAMLTTADGLNLCAIGIAEHEVARLAALNSSLFAVSAAHSNATLGVQTSPQDTLINISSRHRHTVIASLVQEPLGQMLLALTASNINLGTLVVETREGAERVREWLRTSA